MKPTVYKFTTNSFQSSQAAKMNAAFQMAPVETVTSVTTQATLLTLLEKPRIFSGYMNGYRQPVGLVKLQVLSFDLSHIQSLHQALAYYFNDHLIKFNAAHSENDLVACLGEGMCALQKTAELPIFEAMQINAIPDKTHAFSLWVPMLHEDCFHQTMAFMLQFFNLHLASKAFHPNQKLSEEIAELISRLKTYAPSGSNSLRLLEAAYRDEIAWTHLAQNTFQYGYGRNSRWFDSTFTDNTSQIATKLVKNKHDTFMLLRKAGLPIPQQEIVRSEAEAVEDANRIGYPVVIKPHNQDGGKGVFARLTSDSQVRKAYQLARQYSEIVLLEKHIIGKDYRLLVLNGELIWTVERIPAGVTGDGIRNINELIVIANQQPDRGKNKHSALKQIEITDDTIDFLADQGYELNSIPKQGQFIPVSRIANISTGGTPVAVLGKIHEDNKRLIETAAKLLRLNIAGIDFITPDIQQSYMTTGGSLIEINSQPQLGIITAPHIYKQVLATLVPNKGRIPIIVICSHAPEDFFIQKLNLLLLNYYKNIGMVKDNSAYLNSEKIAVAHSFHAAGGLLLNGNLDVLVYVIQSWDDINHQGLPFDQYDFLFFLDAPQKDSQQPFDLCLMNTLFRACKGYQLVTEKTLDYLETLNDVQKPNMMLAKSNTSSMIEEYPDFIKSVSYLDDENQLIIQSIRHDDTIPSKITINPLHPEDVKKRDHLLISLWNWLHNNVDESLDHFQGCANLTNVY